MPDPADENEDQRSFALLNAYLDDLHAGRQPDRAELVRDHPELVVAIECLDAIDQLVPAPPAGSGTIHSEPTQLQLAPVGSAPTDTAAHVPLLGAFGDFDLINELGRGGMGVVYQARQKSLDRPVAVKMILASHLASPEQVERFRTEAKAAARACHPNIVGIHEIGELHGQHYFVMDYIEGQNLAELLQGGPMELEAAASCVAKIARAVHHLHQHGIVHRDLKPSNVLMDRNGEPHLTDFGLAKTLLGDSHMTHAGAIVGTPSYMSPEQAAGRVTDVGPASDVYSLGALLYDLITGQPPFRESTPLDTLVQVLEGEPRLPSELNRRIPSDLEMICLRCLEKLPEQRYRSAEDLASDLERFLRGDSVEARPPNLYMRVRRWSRREPALSSRLGVLALCVGILQFNFWLTAGSEDRVDPHVHLQVMMSLGIWAIASFGFQQLMSRQKWAEATRYAWAGTDALLLTLIFWLTGSVQSPVVVTYPGLIAASGLWFRQRLVWFMTAVCLIAYTVLLVDWKMRGEQFDEPMFRHVILMVVFAGVGSVVGYQVKRIRALSSHYEHRQLP